MRNKSENVGQIRNRVGMLLENTNFEVMGDKTYS